MEGTGAPVGWCSDQTVNSQQSIANRTAENSAAENDLEAEKECDILTTEAVSFREIANKKIRAKLICLSGTEMEEIERHSVIGGLFLTSSLRAAIFLGQDCSENLRSVRNTEQKPTLQKLFDVTPKLISEQKLETSGV